MNTSSLAFFPSPYNSNIAKVNSVKSKGRFCRIKLSFRLPINWFIMFKTAFKWQSTHLVFSWKVAVYYFYYTGAATHRRSHKIWL